MIILVEKGYASNSGEREINSPSFKKKGPNNPKASMMNWIYLGLVKFLAIEILLSLGNA